MKCSHILAAAALLLCAGVAANAQVVISQIYGGGGNSGSRWTNDFIELHNNSGSPVSLAGWSVQYSSQGASTWTATNLSGSIPAWGYYLIQEGPGAGGTEALPTPDASGAIPMNGTQAKVALVNSTTVLTDASFTNASPDGTGPTIVDIVGYGTTSVARREGLTNAPAPSNTASIIRLNNGCTDTGQNGDDFILSQGGAAAIQPRNTSFAIFNCSGPSNDADIQALVTNNTGTCVQTAAYGADYVFTVTNAGPSNATGVSASVTFASNVAPTIVANGGTSYANGTWTIGALNSGESKTLTFTVAVSSPGATRAQINATASGNTDPTPGNNQATASNTFPDAVTPAKAVFRSASIDTTSGTFGQDTANIGTSGFQFAGKTFAFGRPFFSPNGHRWIMVAEMANLLDSNSLIVVGNDDNYFIALRELPYGSGVDLGGGIKVFSSETQGGNSFDRAAAIDDAGNIAFSCQAVDSPSDTTFGRAVVRGAPGANFGDPYSWTVVAYEGDLVPAAVNTAIGGSNRQWDGQMYVAGINGTDVAFYAHLRAGTPALLLNADEVLVTANGTSVLATESVTIAAPTGYTLMGAAATTNGTDKAFDQNTDANFSTRGFKRAGTHWSSDAAIGRAATPTPAPATADQVLVVDGTVVLREGDLLPGFSGLDTIAAASTSNNLTFFNSLSDDGTWYAYGVNAPVAPATRGTAWVVKGSGASVTVLAKSGDPIVPASSETWSNVVSGQTFLGVVARGNDRVIWGLTSNGDSSRDAVVVWNNGSQNQVLLREGDPIDIGNPGSPNIVYCHSFIDSNRAAVDANRNLWIVAQTRNNQWPCTLASADTLGQVFLKIALPAVSVTCPSIATQPSNQTVACNGTANFTVGVADAGAATYQWRKNGVALTNGAQPNGAVISGATTANLQIAGVRNSNASVGQGSTPGNYDVVVTLAGCPTLTSTARTLTVSPVCKCNPADIAQLGGTLGADGQNTVDDLVLYLSNFFANNLAVADLTNLGGGGGPDGQITVDDLTYFLQQFFAPCANP